MNSPEQLTASASAGGELTKLFPALREGRFLPIGDTRMHYIDAGSGEPILCVHGNPTWSFYWRSVIEAFRGSNRVIAVDHVGCGLSDKPQRYDYCLERHIQNLCSLIESLNLQEITLLVHDWGGPIGVGAAVRMPHRFRRLILTNTACFPPPYVPLRILACRFPLFGSLAIRGLNAFARAAVRMATERPGGLAETARRGMLAPYNNWHNRVALLRFVQDIPLSKRKPTWKLLQQMEDGLRAFRQTPSLLIWGMRDWCFRPECLHRLQKLLPGSQTVEIATAGHYLMEDAPAEVNAAIRSFIQSTSAHSSQVET